MKRLQVRRGSAVLATASFALVVLAACGSPGEEAGHEDVTRVATMSDAAAQATREAPPPGASPEGELAAANGESTPAEGGETAAAMSVEVVSHDIYFEPAEITIPANTDVTFVLPNQGVTAHNFAIDALGIDIDQAPGSTEDVVVNAAAGTYEYYCNVPGHKAAGMVGTLIVSEDAAAAPAAGAAEATPVGEASPAAAEAATPVAVSDATPAAAVAATPADATAATETEDAAADAADAVQVTSYDIYFEPKELAIAADTDVTVTLPNAGVTLHNFAIDALGIDVDIAPGETQEVVINAPAGTYEYYCNVPGHKAAGMAGTLTVG